MGFKTNNKDIAAKCEYCVHARMPKERQVVICVKKGVVESDFSCRKFKYDPLKRVPTKIVLNTDFSEDDFII